MSNDIHFTHDAATVSVKDDVFVEQDSADEQRIDWDSLETVRVDDPPYVEAFDTKEFYKVPITAARPVEQQYHVGDSDVLTLKKPRSELKRAAWSLDRRPVTLGHPDSKMVKSVSDIHGFHSDVEYYDSTDELDAMAYIPVDDTEAQNHIETNNDVSIGFHHAVTPPNEFDGVVGGADDDTVDGYQTDLYINHSAFVSRGRCSSEQGCGIDNVGSHGTMMNVDSADGGENDTLIMRSSEDSEETDQTTMEQTTDAPEGIHMEDGTYYGIAPSENSEGVPKYELDNCSDVSDAWKLRSHGHYDIEQSTLESRIKRMNEYHGCGHSFDEGETDSLLDQISAGTDYAIVPADCTDCPEYDTLHDTTMDISIDFDDLSTEAALRKLGESHDGLAEVADEYGELEQVNDVAQNVAEELDTSVDELPDAVSELKEDAEQYQEIQEERMREDAEELAGIVDKYDDADAVIDAYDADSERIEEQLELLKSATEDADTSETEETDTTETTVDSEPDDNESEQAGQNRVVPSAWE